MNVAAERGRNRGAAKNKALGNAGWRDILKCAREGKTLDETARYVGISPGSIKVRLYRQLGSTAWPIPAEKLEGC